MSDTTPIEPAATNAPAPKPKRTAPLWLTITLGATTAIFAMSAAGAAAGRDGEPVSAVDPQPAPTVTVTAQPEADEDAAELAAQVAALEAQVENCQSTIVVVVDASTIMTDAFIRQTEVTYQAALYGATDALVAEQEAINAEVQRATSTLDGARGC